ncbi:MAG: FtsQ-type POTRA domain-containing protein [Rickettsiaceae bacterium]|nr:FtsQ-type POTRA domain-containing protein [Rickettsiaceae bacterium]
MQASIKKSAKTSNPIDITLKRKVAIFYSRLMTSAKLLFLITLIILTAINFISPNIFDLSGKFAEFTQDYGYSLEKIVIRGQKNLTSAEITSALNADVGTPIFHINLNHARQSLENNRWVKHAIIQRKLPNKIVINIKERDAVAIWQMHQKLHVIDQDGKVLQDVYASNYKNLIHVVGEDANIYAAKLLEDINSNPNFAKKIVNAVRFGKRRWDINLKENINVKMPEDSFLDKYRYLIKLDKEGKLFGNNIKSIDLRDNDRIYIEKTQNYSLLGWIRY